MIFMFFLQERMKVVLFWSWADVGNCFADADF